MLEKSTTLAFPKNSLQPLWRYMSADRLLDFLRTSELFFTHLPTLDDAKEGELTKRTREHLAKWYQQQDQSNQLDAHAQVAEYQRTQRYFYVNCWHMNDYESYLMWKAYGDRGFAIQTTFERVQAAFEISKCVVTGGVVEYIDFERDITPVGNVFNHVATKDMPYRDEREFRIVFWDVDPRNSNFPKVSAGVRIQVDVSMLVGAIVQSPYSAHVDSELMRLIANHKLTFKGSAVTTKQKTGSE